MSNLNKRINDTSARLGEVRFSYAYVFEKRTNQDGTPGKYSLCCIIPKRDTETVALFNEIVEAAKLKGKSEKWGGKIPAKVGSPLRDGDIDKEGDPNFAGCWFFNCSSTNKPGLRVREAGIVSEALDAEDFYSGCYGAVTVNAFPYNSNGNVGVGMGLNNAIKLRDGDKLSGGRSADEDFGDL